MTLKLRKLSILIIATVMLVAMAFAGAASATDITSSEEYKTKIIDVSSIDAGTYYIKGSDWTIPSSHNLTNGLIINGNVVLDFTNFTGGFAGIPTATSGYNKGGLFGNVSLGTNTLKIIGLNMTSVNVTSFTGNYIGGIIGLAKGTSVDSSKLNFTNCHLVNCSIGGTSSTSFVGGLVGGAYSASVNVEDCSVKHCDVVSGILNVGGLVGYADSASIMRGNVTNSTVASTGNGNVGGLVGNANTAASFDSCSVENTSMYASGLNVGGLIGKAAISKIGNCMVKNCVIASGSYRVGGLVGYATPARGVGNCHVVNCTIKGSNNVGGLVGYANSTSGWSNNEVLNSAVDGSATNTTLVCGNLDMYAYCTADVTKNFIYNGSTYADTITLNKSNNEECPLDTNFWNSISYAYATSTRGVPSAKVTSLGKYGYASGYGVGSATYTVTYDGNGATGDAPVDINKYKGGDQVTVADKGNLVKTGYVFNGWSNGSAVFQSNEKFTITKNTVLTANWIPEYVEVASWSELVSSVTEWTSNDKMRTIVLTNAAAGAYTNTTGTEGEYAGIQVAGNITIKPAENKDIIIDANQKGLLFNVEGGNLTICENTSATLTLTGGKTSGVCSGISVWPGTFTMNGGTITNCIGGTVGGVFIIGGQFIMTGGNITGCSGTGVGGVSAIATSSLNVSGTSTITGNTVNGGANNVHFSSANTLNLVGPFTGTISINNDTTYPTPTVGAKFGNYVSGNTADAKNFVSDMPGYCGNVSGSDLVWAVINTTVTPTSGVAEFSGANATVLKSNDKVSVVILENVSNVEAYPVTFNASSSITTELPALNGYTKDEDIAIFEITATTTGSSIINLTVTFKDVATATANKNKIHIFHHTSGAWQQLTSSILADDGNKVTYKVVTNGFSPFGIGIYTPTTTPSYSGSTKQTGYTQILSQGQVAPTNTPTVAPTAAPTSFVNPTAKPTSQATTQPTQSSPAPIAGIIVGLGTAVFVYRMRK